jgi:hypothetical protein
LRAIKINNGNLRVLKPLVDRNQFARLKQSSRMAYEQNTAVWFIPMHIRADGVTHDDPPMNMIVPYTYIQKHFDVGSVLNGVEDWVELIPKVKKKVDR